MTDYRLNRNTQLRRAIIGFSNNTDLHEETISFPKNKTIEIFDYMRKHYSLDEKDKMYDMYEIAPEIALQLNIIHLLDFAACIYYLETYLEITDPSNV